MKKAVKIMVSLVMALCLLSVPFASAFAAAAPVDLMPTDAAGYTIVSGDGTVSVEGGKMTIVNNADGDLRITINNATKFDIATLHTLHMDFNAQMPFKMAYHIVCPDGTGIWPNTSTTFTDQFTIDTATDRAAAGEYNVKMNMTDAAAALADKSQVYFEQFIILVTGKGTFTVNSVKMTDGTETEGGETTTTASATETTTTAAIGETTTTAVDTATTTGADTATTTEAAVTTTAQTTAASTTVTTAAVVTTTAAPADSDQKAGDNVDTGETTDTIVMAVIALAIAAVVTVTAVSKKNKTNG